MEVLQPQQEMIIITIQHTSVTRQIYRLCSKVSLENGGLQRIVIQVQARFTLATCQVDHVAFGDANYSNKYNTLLHHSRLTVL